MNEYWIEFECENCGQMFRDKYAKGTVAPNRRTCCQCGCDAFKVKGSDPERQRRLANHPDKNIM